MNNLNELIGKKVSVIFYTGDDGSINGDYEEVLCEIINVNIEDFYYLEKGEPIFIEVNAKPLEEFADDYIDWEDFNDIPLSNIRFAGD